MGRAAIRRPRLRTVVVGAVVVGVLGWCIFDAHSTPSAIWVGQPFSDVGRAARRTGAVEAEADVSERWVDAGTGYGFPWRKWEIARYEFPDGRLLVAWQDGWGLKEPDRVTALYIHDPASGWKRVERVECPWSLRRLVPFR
jgi:hypothetical protein